MDDSLMLRVFDWQGNLHVTVDRVQPHRGRKYAPRDRVWSSSVQLQESPSEWAAMHWAVAVLAGRLGLVAHAAGEACSGVPLGGPQGVHAPSARLQSDLAKWLYDQKQGRPPLEDCGAEGVSDGLEPKGHTPPLF